MGNMKTRQDLLPGTLDMFRRNDPIREIARGAGLGQLLRHPAGARGHRPHVRAAGRSPADRNRDCSVERRALEPPVQSRPRDPRPDHRTELQAVHHRRGSARTLQRRTDAGRQSLLNAVARVDHRFAPAAEVVADGVASELAQRRGIVRIAASAGLLALLVALAESAPPPLNPSLSAPTKSASGWRLAPSGGAP